MVSYRLRPNQVAVGFRLLARNLAIGWQIEQAAARPTVIQEPRAFRAQHVEGLGRYAQHDATLIVHPLHAAERRQVCALPWTHRTVQLVA